MVVYGVELEEGDGILLKIGTEANELLNLESLVGGIAKFIDRERGCFRTYPYLVTSGAIGKAAESCGLTQLPTDTVERQTYSSLGEQYLGVEYDKAFQERGMRCNQMLVTQDILESEEAFPHVLNVVRNAHSKLWVPRFNALDIVTIKEVDISDNDMLARYIAPRVGAKYVVIVSDSGGLYDIDPNGPENANLIEVCTEEDLLGILEIYKGLESGIETKARAGLELAGEEGITVIIVHPMHFVDDDSLECVLKGRRGNAKILRTIIPAGFDTKNLIAA